MTFFFSVINFFILIALMVRYLRRPVIEFVQNRHTSILDELKKTKEELGRAQENYDKFSSKLMSLDSEVSSLRNYTAQDIEGTKKRIMDEARRSSYQIITDARAGVDGLFADLKANMYMELVSRVLSRTEELLRDRLTGDDKLRIREEFSKQVEIVQ